MKHKDKIEWKRAEKATGLQTVGFDNRRRSWYLSIDGVEVGCISHTHAVAPALRWSTRDEESAWKIMFYVSKGSNIVMKTRFPTPDRCDEKAVIAAAKAAMLKMYPSVREKYPSVRQAPLE